MQLRFCVCRDVPSGGCELSWSSDRTLLIVLGVTVDEPTRRRVAATASALGKADLAALLEVTCAYTSVQLTFDADALARDERLAPKLESIVRRVITNSPCDDAQLAAEATPRTIEIPVCYERAEPHGDSFAPDLDEVSRRTGLTQTQVVTLHSSATYRVHFLGFMPGFAYLSGLPAALHVPRRDSPRTRVPAGSVAIAGGQAGVYPSSTPGGWHIIGRTPLKMFDPVREQPALLRAGDVVRFVPITFSRFDELARGHST